MVNVGGTANTPNPYEAWIQTFSGKRVFPLRLKPEDISIIDIAHALSMQCRFAGHCKKFYSVAEHSVLLSYAVPQECALDALLHDASEAYLVDLPAPVKAQMLTYKRYEQQAEAVIRNVFHLADWQPLDVHEADRRIVLNEKTALMGDTPYAWNLGCEPLPNVNIRGLTPGEAEAWFLSRFFELYGNGPAAPLPRVANTAFARELLGKVDIPTSSEPESILQEAQRIIHGPRNAAYGPPKVDMGRTGRMWAAILGVPEVTAEQVAICMIALKLSRQCHKPGRDNLVDICGYVGTIEMMSGERHDGAE